MKLPSSLSDWIKQGDAARRRKRRKTTPGLAEDISALSGCKLNKRAVATLRASVADRLMALVEPKTRVRL